MASADVKHGLEPARWQRSLLPGSMVDGPGARRKTVRDWAVDACVSIVAVSVGVAALHGSWETHGTVARIVDIVLGLAAIAALWDRRRHPVGVAAFVIPASAFSALAAGAGLVVLFNAAIRCDRRTLAWIAIASVAASVVYGLFYSTGLSDFLDNVAIGVLLFGFAIGWGLFVRVRRDLVHSLHERAAQLEEEGRLRADQARAAERERIAREMHDVLAHRLSLLSLHAGALEYRPEALPEEEGNIGRTAYRVVQEGLTNARKHAPGVLVRVRVAESEEGLEIELRNGAPLSPLPAPALPGAGSGLIGLGERVGLAGGELRHQLTANGDFVLTATLPLEPGR